MSSSVLIDESTEGVSNMSLVFHSRYDFESYQLNDCLFVFSLHLHLIWRNNMNRLKFKSDALVFQRIEHLFIGELPYFVAVTGIKTAVFLN